MSKRVIEIFSNPRTCLSANDISVDEKKRMSEYFCNKGFSESTFYLRFSQKGFDQWELDGVKECKEQFLLIPTVAQSLLEYPTDANGEDDTDKGYLYTLAKSDTPGCFYECLRKVCLCNRFTEFMSERGMSVSTAIKRFTTEQWKPWEVDGIKSLLKAFYAEQEKKEADE